MALAEQESIERLPRGVPCGAPLLVCSELETQTWMLPRRKFARNAHAAQSYGTTCISLKGGPRGYTYTHNTHEKKERK